MSEERKTSRGVWRWRELERKRPWWCRTYYNSWKNVMLRLPSAPIHPESFRDKTTTKTLQFLNKVRTQLPSTLYCEPQLRMHYNALMASETLFMQPLCPSLRCQSCPISVPLPLPKWTLCMLMSLKACSFLFSQVGQHGIITPPNTYYNIFLPAECWPMVPSFTIYRIIKCFWSSLNTRLSKLGIQLWLNVLGHHRLKSDPTVI